MLILYMTQNEAHPYKTVRYQEWMSNQTERPIHLQLKIPFSTGMCFCESNCTAL